MVCKSLPVLSKTTHSEPPSPPSTPGARGALISAAVFPAVGGAAVGLWLENVTAGIVGYYALLALALASPEGAALRDSFGRRGKPASQAMAGEP